MKLLIGLLLLISAELAAKPIIVWNRLMTHPNTMVPELLKRSLEITKAEYGRYQLIPSGEMEQGRAVRRLEEGENLHIAVFGPNQLRELVAIPVRFPVTGTLLSYRICLIRSGTQAKFDDIQDLAELRNSGLIIGQHQDWPDATILEANGLTLWRSIKYDLLFDQLIAGRFDCFSRGANEVVQEYYSQGYKGIEIEQELVVYYPFPLFYFVNKAYPELAERIELGLKRLHESGEFKQMFNENYQFSLKKLRLSERTVIELTNPLLTDKTKKVMEKMKPEFSKLVLSP